MKTKHITLAVAATLLAPAAVMADNSSVEIYGRLNLDLENVRANGSTIGDNIPSRNRVSSNSSMIGFRGTEDLGGDLKAFFQIESQINADTGTATSTTGVFAGRNSGVGLKGSWGSVLMGRWDTPYKVAQVKFDPFRDVTIASEQNVLGQMSTTPSGDFHPRFSNSIQYWTPELAGFSGRLDYSANEGKTATVNPSGLSGALYYDQGPFYAVLAHERHNDSGVLVAGARGDDKGTEAGFGFRFGSTKLGLLYERLEYKTEAAGGSNLRRNAWFLGGEHRIDNIILRGYYGNAGDQSGSFTDGPRVVTGAGTGAKMYSLGGGYTLSKRTELYASYTRINNESNATYEFGINPTPGLAVTKTGAARNPGIDPSGFLIGMVHLF